MIEYTQKLFIICCCLNLYQLLSKKMELQFQKLGKPNRNHVMFDNYLKNPFIKKKKKERKNYLKTKKELHIVDKAF